jgi:cytochrome c553
MNLMKFISTGAGVALFSMSTIVLAGGDVEAGKEIAVKVCAACHGADGNSQIPTNPKLAGQYESYLARALMDYQSGARKNPIMSGFAATLSDEDIENVSAYFSSQTGQLNVLK